MTDYGVEITVIMPTDSLDVEVACSVEVEVPYSLEVVADTEDDAVKQALCELNERGDIPDHGEVDVFVYDLSTYSV